MVKVGASLFEFYLKVSSKQLGLVSVVNTELNSGVPRWKELRTKFVY